MLDEVDPELLPVLAERLKALADPLRLRLMRQLSAGELSVGELVDAIGTTQPNISRHLARLEQGGWIARRRDGNRVLIRVADEVDHALCAQLCGLVRRQAERDARRAGVGSEVTE